MSTKLNTPTALSALNAEKGSVGFGRRPQQASELPKRFSPWQGVDDFFEEADDARLHRLGVPGREIEQLIRDRDSFAIRRKRSG